MIDQRKPVVRITTTDLETGETETRELPAGEYAIVVTEPRHIDGIQEYRGGQTVVLTVKGRQP